MSDAPALDGLREEYGGQYLVCQVCGHALPVDELIDNIEQQDVDTIFTPEKISDLAYAVCEECGRLRLHELKDEKDAIEPEEQSDGHSNSQSDADSPTEPKSDSSESSGSSGTFSI